MNQHRIDFFRQLTDDAKASLNKDDFTVSEIVEIIDDTALTGIERQIALKRYTECKTFEQIADETKYDVRTIRRKLPDISLKLKRTCTKLFM